MGQYDSITGLGLKFEDGDENASGIQEVAYLIPLSFFQTLSKPGALTTAASIATIVANHTLKTGKAPIEVHPLYNKSGSSFKLSGEEMSKLFESDVDFFIPQINAAALGSVTALKNYRFIILHRRVGQTAGFYQIGSKEMSAKVQDIAGGLGTGPTGEVGYRIQLKAFDVVPMYYYAGELPVAGV